MRLRLVLVLLFVCGPARTPARAMPAQRYTSLLPESVRSVLLMHFARDLSKDKANELEAALRKEPDKIDDRLTLIGYYSWKGRTPAEILRLRNHVLWMIGNHREHVAAAESGLRDLPDDPEGNAQLLALWLRELESHGDDIAVLRNAERFFFGKDPAAAERILRRLSEREPENRQWPNELVKLYAIVGIPDYVSDDPAKEALEAYSRVLESTKNSIARERLASEMAQSAFKVGKFAAAAEFAKLDLQSSDAAAVQRANTILGRIALRSGDTARAKQFLHDSAGSGVAPTMVLAKELLEKGERDAVLDFLESCLTTWPQGESTLEIWIADIKNGRTPNFGTLGF